MAHLINKKIIVDNREWIVLGTDEYLEIFYVREAGRQFKTVIGFEEVK